MQFWILQTEVCSLVVMVDGELRSSDWGDHKVVWGIRCSFIYMQGSHSSHGVCVPIDEKYQSARISKFWWITCFHIHYVRPARISGFSCIHFSIGAWFRISKDHRVPMHSMFPWTQMWTQRGSFQDVGSAEGSRTLKMRTDFLFLAGTSHFYASLPHR